MVEEVSLAPEVLSAYVAMVGARFEVHRVDMLSKVVLRAEVTIAARTVQALHCLCVVHEQHVPAQVGTLVKPLAADRAAMDCGAMQTLVSSQVLRGRQQLMARITFPAVGLVVSILDVLGQVFLQLEARLAEVADDTLAARMLLPPALSQQLLSPDGAPALGARARRPASERL